VRRIVEQAHGGCVGYTRLADSNSFFIELALAEPESSQ
jgi:hypothetical protein